jgi:hypothetical protein
MKELQKLFSSVLFNYIVNGKPYPYEPKAYKEEGYNACK